MVVSADRFWDEVHTIDQLRRMELVRFSPQLLPARVLMLIMALIGFCIMRSRFSSDLTQAEIAQSKRARARPKGEPPLRKLRIVCVCRARRKSSRGRR